jgi:hypothetical protein
MLNLLIWLNLVSGLSYFISDSEYTENFRQNLEKLEFKFKRFEYTFRTISNIMDCGLCTTFYIGIILSGFISSPTKFFFDYDNSFVIIIADGGISIVYGILFRILIGFFSHINLKNKK